MKDSQHNRAFISYSHSDEHWTRWLQQSLEKYRTPKTLFQVHPHLPKRLFPIFQDRDEHASFTIKPIKRLIANDLGLQKIELEIALVLKKAEYGGIRTSSAYTLSGNPR